MAQGNDTELKQEEPEARTIYAPNSIYHGCPIIGFNEEIALKIQIGRLTDFIEWLFEHSGHCDHVSQSDAWREFEAYEIEQSNSWR